MELTEQQIYRRLVVKLLLEIVQSLRMRWGDGRVLNGLDLVNEAQEWLEVK